MGGLLAVNRNHPGLVLSAAAVERFVCISTFDEVRYVLPAMTPEQYAGIRNGRLRLVGDSGNLSIEKRQEGGAS